jgi:hypothetical protein
MTSGGGVYGGRPVGVNASWGLRRSVSRRVFGGPMHVVKRARERGGERDTDEVDEMRHETRHDTPTQLTLARRSTLPPHLRPLDYSVPSTLTLPLTRSAQG